MTTAKNRQSRTAGNKAKYAHPRRATFKIIVLRRQYEGGIYCPSPSPPASPTHKKIGGVCSLHPTTWHYSLFWHKSRKITNKSLLLIFSQSPSGRVPVANPSFNGSKGEGQPTAVAVGWKVKKNVNIHVYVFFLKGGVLPPPPSYCRSGSYYARPNPRYLQEQRIQPRCNPNW